MGLNIFLLVVFVFMAVITTIGGLMDDDGESKFFLWLGGLFTMSAIWEIWIIYKFYLLPLNL